MNSNPDRAKPADAAPAPTNNRALDDRVAHLETLLMHFERTIETLNGVVIEQSQQLAALERKLGGLEGQVQNVAGAIRENRSLEEEKPPHY